MICYICKMEVQDLDALVVHYKIIHVLKPNSTYTCCEESCSQSFNALSSFKRHVLKKHICVHVSPNMQQNVQN